MVPLHLAISNSQIRSLHIYHRIIVLIAKLYRLRLLILRFGHKLDKIIIVNKFVVVNIACLIRLNWPTPLDV